MLNRGPAPLCLPPPLHPTELTHLPSKRLFLKTEA